MPSLPGLLGFIRPSGLLGPLRPPADEPAMTLLDRLRPYPAWPDGQTPSLFDVFGPRLTPFDAPTTPRFDPLSPFPAPADELRTPLLGPLSPYLSPLDGQTAPHFDSPLPENIKNPSSTFALSSAFLRPDRGPTLQSVTSHPGPSEWLPDIGLIGTYPGVSGNSANFGASGRTFPQHWTNTTPELPPEIGSSTRPADEQFARSNEGIPMGWLGDREVASDADPEAWISGADYAQARSGRGTRGPGGRELSPLQEIRLVLYSSAQRTLQELDPKNPQLSSLSSPTWVPTGRDIKRLNDEIARLRSEQSLFDLEKHHLLPRQFFDKLEPHDIDPENFVMFMRRGPHRLLPDGVHTGPDHWNGQWARFYEDNLTPKRRQIFEQLNDMLKKPSR